MDCCDRETLERDMYVGSNPAAAISHAVFVPVLICKRRRVSACVTLVNGFYAS